MDNLLKPDYLLSEFELLEDKNINNIINEDLNNEDSDFEFKLGDDTEIDMCYEIYDNSMNQLLNESIVKKVKDKIKVFRNDTKHKIDKMDNKADQLYRSIKEDSQQDNRERVIRGSMPKLSSLIKYAVATGTTAAINPAIAAVGLVATIAIKKSKKRSEKDKILNELKAELEIVEEKIRDADSNCDKSKKYELMRLRNKLRRELDIITYGRR